MADPLGLLTACKHQTEACMMASVGVILEGSESSIQHGHVQPTRDVQGLCKTGGLRLGQWITIRKHCSTGETVVAVRNWFLNDKSCLCRSHRPVESLHYFLLNRQGSK